MSRADLNTALVRHSCGNWGKEQPALDKLVMKFGKPAEIKVQPSKVLAERFKVWAEKQGK
jgi:hypothetical protein